MSTNRSPVIISAIAALLVIFGMAFQNCAQPLDPSLLEDSKTNSSEDSGIVTSFDFDQVSFDIYDQPVLEGKTAYIYANGINNIKDDASFIYRINGSAKSYSHEFSTSDLKVGDQLTLDISYNGENKTINVPVNIQKGDGTTTPNPGAILYIAPVNGSPSFGSHFISDASVLSLYVQLDYNKDSSLQSEAPFIKYEWEFAVQRMSLPSDSPAYKAMDNKSENLVATASKDNISKKYRVRAFDTRNPSRKSSWEYYNIVASEYKASVGTKAKLSNLRISSNLYKYGTTVSQCESPYFVSGFYTKEPNLLTGVKCSLVKSKSESDVWYGGGSSEPQYDRFYKAGTKYCYTSARSDLPFNQLLSGVMFNYQGASEGSYGGYRSEKGFFYECHNIGSQAAFYITGPNQTVTYTSSSDQLFTCPENQFVTSISRQSIARQYSLSSFQCAKEQ